MSTVFLLMGLNIVFKSLDKGKAWCPDGISTEYLLVSSLNYHIFPVPVITALCVMYLVFIHFKKEYVHHYMTSLLESENHVTKALTRCVIFYQSNFLVPGESFYISCNPF